MQFGDDHPDDDGPQNAGVDGADAEDGFHPVGLLRRRVTDDVGHGEVEVDGEVEGRIADETGKGRHPLLFARQPERNGHREHHRQVDKGHQPHLGHPEEQQLQHGIVEEGHALLDRIAGERAADTEQNAREGQQGDRQHKGLAEALQELPDGGFGGGLGHVSDPCEVRVIRYACPVASLTDGNGESHLVLLDDKTFYQLTSAGRITEYKCCQGSACKTVSRIGPMVM